MSRRACIVGAGALEEGSLFVPQDALIIAADGGLSHLEKAGITPELIVGDFDSLGRVPEGKNVIVTPAEKDDTDMLLAVKLALERGCGEIYLYGGMGGRFEHSLANLQTLYFIAQRGARGYLIGDSCVCTVIKNASLCFDSSFSGYVSVFAAGGNARGVNLRGLKYPLTDYEMTCDFPIGVSNEFMGVPAEIAVEDGSVAAVWHFENGSVPGFPI